ncbi:hypothetical protein ACH42_08305 [Endozoicomonas sp. (ex Bugula neritina AB1)]|nr:hypothetical protein ACH42_08305 [Endozoicomonas sp. (ex Bugula neritina AB1)]
MWSALLGVFITFSLPVIWIVLRGLGFGLVTYGGLTLLTEFLGDKIQENFDGMPIAMYQMISLLGIPTAVNIMLSVLTAVVVIKGLLTATGTARKKPVWNAPSGNSGLLG